MIKLNFKDGTTLEFNLEKEDDLKQWLEWSRVEDFQNRITGIGILHDKKHHTLPLPKGFRHIRFFAELMYSEKGGEKRLLGERVSCHSDNVQISMLVYTYKKPPILTRVDVRRIGYQRGPSMK